MPALVYFEDALTRREVDTPWNGRPFGVVYGAGVSPKTAVAYDDTAYHVEVKDGRRYRTITADDFPGQLVVAKLWTPGASSGLRAIEKRLLVTRDDGFVTFAEVEGRGRRLGDGTRDHERGEILKNRKALEYLAARRRAMSPATVAAAFGKGR